MRKILTALLAALLLCGLSGCNDASALIQNKDDGKLCVDEQQAIDFYLGNDEEGADPITAQCLAIIGERKPDSTEPIDGITPGELYTYRVNGLKIRIFHYGMEQTVLLRVELDANHALSGGIRIGSTEEELKRAYDGKPEFYFRSHDSEDGETRCYVLEGGWFEQYPILFEVDPDTGAVTGISYELDI